MIVLAETSKQKGGYMNSITNLLDFEDTDIEITDIQIQGQTKTLTLSTPPVPHFCPSCGFRMYSRGIKKRIINLNYSWNNIGSIRGIPNTLEIVSSIVQKVSSS